MSVIRSRRRPQPAFKAKENYHDKTHNDFVVLGPVVGSVLAAGVLFEPRWTAPLAPTLSNFTFVPQPLTVKVGTTVTGPSAPLDPGSPRRNTPSPDRGHWTPTTAIRTRSLRRVPTSTSATSIPI